MPGAGRWVQEGRVAAAAVLKVEPAAEQAWQLEGRGVSREAGPRQLRRWQSMARAAHAEHKIKITTMKKLVVEPLAQRPVA